MFDAKKLGFNCNYYTSTESQSRHFQIKKIGTKRVRASAPNGNNVHCPLVVEVCGKLVKGCNALSELVSYDDSSHLGGHDA